MTPKARARTQIYAMLGAAGWIVQNRDELNLDAGAGAPVREVPTPSAPPANILLFREKKPSGTVAAARCNDMLPLVRGLSRDDRTAAC